MSLAVGTRFGPYEVVSALGAGGMGEVYRARDTRLGRDVAIKILPKEMSADATRKQRFEREAKAISVLNHPNICVLHDVGSQDGVDYLVMECVEGETLAKRLEKGPLPVEQVLKYGAQIADALGKAHRAGIVHRDLKPGNVMVTSSGAKLLDFGLAKPAVALTSAATLTVAASSSPVTEQGTIIGTFQYMSPEQVEGKELDGRSDIFSLGAVLYEMVTGQRAFDGKSQLSVASAVLEKDPAPIRALKPLTPAPLEHTIWRCLAKEPEKRWQSSADLAAELQWIAESGPTIAMSRGEDAKGGNKGILGLGLWIAGSLILAVIAGVTAWKLKPEPELPVTRFVIQLPAGQKLAGLNQPAVAISPDGKLVAYVGTAGEKQQIFVRPLNGFETRPVSGTEGAISPFFSPDGHWLGFITDDKMKKISLNGGGAFSLTDVTFAGGASWADSGTIAFSPRSPSGLLQVSDAGGAAQPLTRLRIGQTIHRWPELLPAQKAVLFATSPTSFAWATAEIQAQRLPESEPVTVIKEATYPRYTPSGHLAYAQGGNLMAVPFDPEHLQVKGKAVPVVEGISESLTTGAAQYSFSANGTLVYISGRAPEEQRKLVWVDRNGIEKGLPAPLQPYLFPRISPDGRQVAIAITRQGSQIWKYDLDRETLSRLTFEGSVNINALWTLDGQRIAYDANEEGRRGVLLQRADGSGGVERLTTSQSTTQVPMSWSPDGQFLAYIDVNPETSNDIWVMRMRDRKAEPFLKTSFNESVPRFSPDSSYLLYVSNESGRFEVYVQPYPGPGGKWQVSTEGGTEPNWNRNGREIFYRSGNKMMAVDVSTHPGFSAGKPRILFQGEYLHSPVTSPNYDISPDGQKFLMLRTADSAQAAPTEIEVVLNWFEELKQRVPAGKD